MRFLSIWLLILTLGAWCSCTTALAQNSPQVLSFGIVPQQSTRKLAQLWVPVLDYLERSSGIDIRFRTAPNIPEFERRVTAGNYDFAYMNPYHYTVFSQQPGYRAFAKAKGKRIKGIMVVRKDSPIEELRQLDGSTIAFPAPAAFAASVLTRAYLTREDIAFVPRYVSSHDSVYRVVAKGLFPAGGGVVRTFNSMESSIRDQLRILWTTEGFTPHAFAAHHRVPVDVVQRLAVAMFTMAETEQGKALLAPLSMHGFESAEDEDWDDVRALGIRLLDELVKSPH